MRKISFFLLLMVPLISYSQTKEDSAAIRKTCEDYVGGFYVKDTNRINSAMHPELSKRIINARMDFKLVNMSLEELKKAAVNPNRAPDPNPSEPFRVDVTIYDIARDIATVKIATNKMAFFDYAQVGKINGQWKVINVLWAMNR